MKIYDYYIKDLADRRFDNSLWMASPLPHFTLMVIYLLSIYVILPTYMKNRKAYSLKNVIFYYNLFQILICQFLIYETWNSGWTTHFKFGCELMDYSNSPTALKQLNVVYWTYLLKLVELIETCFFVLRKKQNQVSKLHVYHHVSTATLGWVGSKYIAGGMSRFPIIINSTVHVVMYTYYLLASLGPEWQKKIAHWKSKITTMQLIQFLILIVHSSQALLPSCKMPNFILIFYIPNIFLLSNMFYDFYKENYRKKPASKTK